MLSTGMVRRMDDLGRIVIPKEVRERMFGDYHNAGLELEIFIDDEAQSIIFKEPNRTRNFCNWRVDNSEYQSAYIPGCIGRPIMYKQGAFCPMCGKRIQLKG